MPEDEVHPFQSICHWVWDRGHAVELRIRDDVTLLLPTADGVKFGDSGLLYGERWFAYDTILSIWDITTGEPLVSTLEQAIKSDTLHKFAIKEDN